MASFDPHPHHNSAIEQEYFNWKCAICSVVAYSPLELEMQHLPMEISVYRDIDGVNWVKCDKCEAPFHLKCATSELEIVVSARRFICAYFGCRN